MSRGDINLHLHTIASDGIFSVTELITLAQQWGLKTIAITDHDTIDSVKLLKNNLPRGLRIIPGIEFSARFDRHYHILGYFPSFDLPTIERASTRLKQGRYDRAICLIQNLQKKGYDIDMHEVSHIAGKNASIGKPHIAMALLNKGYAHSLDEVFNTIFKKVACVERFKFGAREIIDMIHESGGVAVIAHPKTLNFTPEQFEKFLRTQLNLGIDGIEVFYPTHTVDEIYFYKKLADEFELIVTAGSDFHGYEGEYAIAEISLIRPFDVWAGFEGVLHN